MEDTECSVEINEVGEPSEAKSKRPPVSYLNLVLLNPDLSPGIYPFFENIVTVDPDQLASYKCGSTDFHSD